MQKDIDRQDMARLNTVVEGIKRYKKSSFFDSSKKDFQSSFFHPYCVNTNVYKNLKTFDGLYNTEVDCRTLRRVSKKAWIINLCITNIQKKIKPFLKPSSDKNVRGFVIHKSGENIGSKGAKDPNIQEATNFLLNTGADKSDDRDTFVLYCTKIVRDVLEIDQVATEICYNLMGKAYAFVAVDAATIQKVVPGQDNPDNIKYVQVIDGIPQAYYPKGTMLFGFQNPRSDIYYSAYGYSYVAQAIDLITSNINAFTYNSGFFTENKLPRGMLLLDGNASQETVEQMEEYIYDIMSGSTANQWRIPIIPSGSGGGENNSIKWVSLAGTNKEMEFQGWLDFLTSGIVSLFGCSMEELGLHSAKSQPLFEHNNAPKIEISKSLVLGDTLSFLQSYLNRILSIAFPGYELEFVGYEKDDPKAILDITKGEIETYKTLNEIRAEKGLRPLKTKFADSCPANPQFAQMYQAEISQEEQESNNYDDSDMDSEEWGNIHKAIDIW